MTEIERVKKVLSDRGYLVFSVFTIRPIGSTVTNLGLAERIPEVIGQPFRVTAKTDSADFIEQAKVAGWHLPPVLDPGLLFYRCTTD